MSTDKNIKVKVTGYLTTLSRDLAFQVKFVDSTGALLGYRWLPRSRVTQEVEGEGDIPVYGTNGDKILLEIPLWLAEKPDIAPLIREQLLDQEVEEDDYEDDIPF